MNLGQWFAKRRFGNDRRGAAEEGDAPLARSADGFYFISDEICFATYTKPLILGFASGRVRLPAVGSPSLRVFDPTLCRTPRLRRVAFLLTSLPAVGQLVVSASASTPSSKFCN